VNDIDLEQLRRQARAQLDNRAASPRAAWVLGFEADARTALSPRFELFLRIMAAAGNPGLTDPRDRSDHDRGWIVGHVNDYTTQPLNPYVADAITLLALSPTLGVQTVIGDLRHVSSAIVRRRPQQSVLAGGELETLSALGEVALYRYRPDADPAAEAHRYAEACDRRMLALLCVHELTFPDRDFADVQWDQYESILLTQAERQRRLDSRPVMSVEQFALWMEGKIDDVDAYLLPSLTGSQFAYALSLTSIETRHQMRRNWRNKLIDDGEMGWLVGKVELDKSETSITTRYTYVRRDGTGFEQTESSSWTFSKSVVEFDQTHVYEPGVYSSYLTTRLYYAERGMTA
jgi:hypothetical protein